MFARRFCANLPLWLRGKVAIGVGRANSHHRKYRARLRRFGCVCVAYAVSLLMGNEAHASQFVLLDYNLTLNSRSRDTVFIEVFDDRPLTQANFMQYVNGGLYNGTIMHRLAKDFVLQGGGFYPVFMQEPAPVYVSLNPNAAVDLDGNPATPNPTVINEYGNSPIRSNLAGTIAMAKVSGNPNSATNQWFVNLVNNTGLDTNNGGFTVFAQVLGDGMSLLNAFNTLSIANLNPDVNDDGIRDGGPFYLSATDGVPYLHGSQDDILLVLENAKRIDYLGNGLTTSVPAGGLTFSARDAFIDTGTIFTGTGALTVAAGRTLGIREGFSLTRSLVNFGTLAPGLQLGSITVQSFRQDPGATLEIQLRGTTADTEYDRLVVTGNALLGGDLDVSLISGFVPVAGNEFTILTANFIADNFGNINLPMLTSGLVWNVNKSTTAITLSVAAADYNRDGVVDAADYVLWRKSDGSAAGFDTWRSNLGNTAGGNVGAGAGSLASFAIPEPSAAVLILTAGFLLAASRRPFRNVRRHKTP